MIRELILPQLAMGMSEGTVVQWAIAEGALVQREQPLVSIETEKVVTDLPSPYSGYVHHIANPGDTVPVETPIGLVAETEEEYRTLIADGASAVTLGPEDFVLITTMETVNAPATKIELEPGAKPVHVMIDVYPRSTLQRSGVFFRATKIDPGYKGTLTFGMRNLSQFPFTFELGARVANIVFTTVHGDLARAYEGQWQGGRITTGGFEKQN